MSVAIITFEVSGAPVGKQRHRTVLRKGKGGKMALANITPDKTINYEGLVAWLGKKAMAGRAPLEGLLWAHVTAFFAVPASYSKKSRAEALAGMSYCSNHIDLDNICKSALDGLNGIAYLDDKQVASLTAVKRWAETPRLVISIGMLDTNMALCQNGGLGGSNV
jgi:Holliday junction resolvase RusA-like endonuclease